MTIDVNGTIGRAVASYTGARVLEVEVVAAPLAADRLAIRALTKFDRENATITEFLVTGVRAEDVTADDLEEVEFISWPPSAQA
jgi:hypothetical protein